MKELGLFFKNLRESNGLKTEEVALDLNITVEELKNFENGNVTFFNDIFKIKEIIESSSKYFSVAEDKMIDKFNTFLYDYTSRIPLNEVEKASEENNDKHQNRDTVSPYTSSIKPKKVNLMFKVLMIFSLLMLIYIVYFLIKKGV